jgi:hypothetical protein
MRLPWLSSSRRVRQKPLLSVPFVGRETLLSELDRHLQLAREGTAQYVVLEGPDGSGKSALLTEFARSRCATAQVLLVQLPAGECLLGQEFYPGCLAPCRHKARRFSRRSITIRNGSVGHWR